MQQIEQYFKSIINGESLYTFTVFHLPVLNRTKLAMAIQVSAIGIAINTPVMPILKCLSSTYAKGTWNSQNPNRLTHVVVQVSPAPLKALIITMPIP